MTAYLQEVLHSALQVNPSIQLDQFELEVKLEDTYSTENYDIAYPGL